MVLLTRLSVCSKILSRELSRGGRALIERAAEHGNGPLSTKSSQKRNLSTGYVLDPQICHFELPLICGTLVVGGFAGIKSAAVPKPPLHEVIILFRL